jgi:hypothetical protein
VIYELAITNYENDLGKDNASEGVLMLTNAALC